MTDFGKSQGLGQPEVVSSNLTGPTFFKMEQGEEWYKEEKDLRNWLKRLIGNSTRGIAHIERYSNKPNLFKETVAEHSFYVSYYSLVLGRYLVKKGHVVDFGKLLGRALVHDFEENFTGDLLAPFKHSLGVEDKLTKVAEENMLKEDFQLWKNAKDGSIEGQIISFADKFCVIVKCFEEISAGNKNYISILDSQIERIKKLGKESLFFDLIQPLESLVRELILANS